MPSFLVHHEIFRVRKYIPSEAQENGLKTKVMDRLPPFQIDDQHSPPYSLVQGTYLSKQDTALYFPYIFTPVLLAGCHRTDIALHAFLP